MSKNSIILSVGFVCVLMLTKNAKTSPATSNSRADQTVLVIPDFTAITIGRMEEVANKLEAVASKMEAAVVKLEASITKNEESEAKKVKAGSNEVKEEEEEEEEEVSENESGETSSHSTEFICRQTCNKYCQETCKKYHVITDKQMIFDNAVWECSKIGYSLASIESQLEFDLLTKFIEKNFNESDRFWTSGNDLGSYGLYLWKSTGEPVPHRDSWWQTGEPNHYVYEGITEHCIELSFRSFVVAGGEKKVKLNDHLCYFKKYPICEEYKAW